MLFRHHSNILNHVRADWRTIKMAGQIWSKYHSKITRWSKLTKKKHNKIEMIHHKKRNFVHNMHKIS